jgi:hypothetical protein
MRSGVGERTSAVAHTHEVISILHEVVAGEHLRAQEAGRHVPTYIF